MRKIQESNPENETIYEEEENETKNIDSESTCYITEVMEDWSSVNVIQSLNFATEHKTDRPGEFWPKTLCKKKSIG